MRCADELNVGGGKVNDTYCKFSKKKDTHYYVSSSDDARVPTKHSDTAAHGTGPLTPY
jgi:hypothetical protein